MNYRADITAADAGTLSLAMDEDLARSIERTSAMQLELRLIDPREHSKDQHGKVFALCEEISRWSGHGKTDLVFWHWNHRDDVRYILTDEFCAREGLERFSMADVDMETCRDFITYLVDFCLSHDVPTSQPLGKLAEDADQYIYACMLHRKCSLCGRPADIHHAEDRVGMGRNRNEISHVGMRAMALCRTHHEEAHAIGQKSFNEKHHMRGIKLTRYLCAQLGLNAKGK